MITPANLDLTIYTAATYELQVTLQDGAGDPVDLTERQLAAQVWNTRRSRQLADFTITKTDPTNGVLTLSLTAAQTAELPADKSIATNKAGLVGCWDLRVTEPDGQTVYYWLEGEVKTNVGVTTDV